MPLLSSQYQKQACLYLPACVATSQYSISYGKFIVHFLPEIRGISFLSDVLAKLPFIVTVHAIPVVGAKWFDLRLASEL
jgi:hypothetical protein